MTTPDHDQLRATERGLMPELTEELATLIRIPSVSLPGYPESTHAELARGCDAVVELLRRSGVEQISLLDLPDTAHVIMGEIPAPPGAPTVLLYGHYDVVPAGDESLWSTPPFEPTVIDGNMYGRGTMDDQGQGFMHVAALSTWLANGGLPVNLKVILEGEEEIGSPGFIPFVREHVGELGCDVIVLSDTAWIGRDLPSLTYGLRGIAYMEVTLRTAAGDMHSGTFGGAAPNAAWELTALLQKLSDADGRVAIPGFYDAAIPPTEDERRHYAALPFDEAQLQADLGAFGLPGEAGYTTLERLWARPTLEVNGIWGGWTGEGSKTVIPAEASAKVSMRFVPKQDPGTIARLFEDHVRSLAPAGSTVTVRELHGGDPFLCPVDTPAFAAAERALGHAFPGLPVAHIRAGGSIPIVPEMTSLLGAPAVLIGFGLPDENAHAPNERLWLDNFYGGIRALIHLYEELAAPA